MSSNGIRSVAQPGRVLRSGRRCRRFESSHSDQNTSRLLGINNRLLIYKLSENLQVKTVEVVAAIILHNGKVLATQKGSGEFKGLWEFPGGKIESGETKEEAIIREIKEELALVITPEKLLISIEHDYSTFHLCMHCFLSVVKEGQISLLEHNDACWLSPAELDRVKWLPADIKVVEKLKAEFK